jgi:hypothetical protein
MSEAVDRVMGSAKERTKSIFAKMRDAAIAERTRISCYAALTNVRVCGFPLKKAA